VSLTIGIVGLPNVGKSTPLQRRSPRTTCSPPTTPFATIEPNVGRGRPAPTRASTRLAEVFESQKIVAGGPVSFVDQKIAGLVRGASKGQGEGQTPSSPTSARPARSAQVGPGPSPTRTWCTSRARSRPADDIETITHTELILADPANPLTGALPRLVKGGQAAQGPGRRRRCRVRGRPGALLNEGTTLYAGGKAGRQLTSMPLRELHLLTTKPFLYVFNVGRDRAGKRGIPDGAARAGGPRPRRCSWTRR